MDELDVVTRVGIADCHGIESYLDATELEKEENRNTFGMMLLRATSNRQRHAVVYMAALTKRDDKIINMALKEGTWDVALNHLKATAIKVSFPECHESTKRSWKMIPNSDLDPWH